MQRTPSARMLNQNRGGTNGGVSTLTNRPLVVYGITVPSGNQKLAKLVRYVGQLCLVISMLETIHFIIVLASDPDPKTMDGQSKMLNVIVSFIVFGFLVPFCGYYGARKQDKNSLSLFCFGEGLVAGSACCGLILAVLADIALNGICNSDACILVFSNSTSASTKCNATSWGGQKTSISKLKCESHGSVTAWGSLVISALLVMVGLEAMRQAMSLRQTYHDMKIAKLGQSSHSVVATVPVYRPQSVVVSSGASPATSPDALPIAAVLPKETTGDQKQEEVSAATTV